LDGFHRRTDSSPPAWVIIVCPGAVGGRGRTRRPGCSWPGGFLYRVSLTAGVFLFFPSRTRPRAQAIHALPRANAAPAESVPLLSSRSERFFQRQRVDLRLTPGCRDRADAANTERAGSIGLDRPRVSGQLRLTSFLAGANAIAGSKLTARYRLLLPGAITLPYSLARAMRSNMRQAASDTLLMACSPSRSRCR
jgi:hypothetical protein